MKTVWIVNHHATTADGTTGGARHALLGAQMRVHGWQTVVLAASSEHYTGRQRITGWRMRADEHARGVTFRWIRVRPYRGNGLGRIVNMLAFTGLTLAPGMTRGLPKPDTVIGSSVHPLAAWAGLILARRHGVPFIFEIRDLWPETLIQMGVVARDGWTCRALQSLERHLCANATKIITTMPYAVDYLVSRGVEQEKVVWLANGVEVGRFAHALLPASRESGDQPKHLDFLYFGAFGSANALSVLVNGFARARQMSLPASARLRLVGQGPEREMLEQLISELGMDGSITLEHPVSRDTIPELAATADILVVALLPLELYKYGISLNKLGEYMAAGRPILFAGRARGNAVDERGGVVTECEAESVAAGMIHLAGLNNQERGLLGAHNRRIVDETYSFEALALKLRRTLEECLSADDS